MIFLNIGGMLMRKLSLFTLFLSLMLVLAGCSVQGDTNSIPLKNKLDEYTEEQLNEKLVGVSRDEIIDTWGEPDSMCSGLYCDFYKLNSDDKSIGVYYDEDSRVYIVEKFLFNE